MSLLLFLLFSCQSNKQPISHVTYRLPANESSHLFLGACSKLRKANLSFVMSVRSSVRTVKLDPQWTDFDDICCLIFFLNLAI
jgi:hypothetical protein